MYLRPAFAETDLDRIESLVRNFHFGLLVTHGPNGMDASHIPFAVEREGDVLTVTGHLAAANAQGLLASRALVVAGRDPRSRCQACGQARAAVAHRRRRL